MADTNKIVIVGGGLAGFAAVNILEKKLGADALLLIEPRDYLESPIAVLRGLMDANGFGRTVRKPWSELTSVGRIAAKALSITGNELLLDNGEKVTFSEAIIATGSTTKGFPFLKGGTAKTIAARENDFVAEGERIKNANRILVIGGGPVGVELVGELVDAYPSKEVTLVAASENLLPALHYSAGAKALKVLSALGVTVKLNTMLEKKGADYVDSHGTPYPADLVYEVTGIRTDSIPVDGVASRNDAGQLKVDEHLRVAGRTNVYAIGDVSDIREIKLGANGRTQAGVVASNLVALHKNPAAQLKTYKAAPAMGFVTIGHKAGIAQLPFGRMDFLIGIKQKDLFLSMMLRR